jgi:hypothetical protein
MHVPVSAILCGTPAWVFLLFAYLTWTGLSRLQPRVRPLARVWIMPAIFMAWGLIGLVQRPGDPLELAARWVIGALVGGILGAAVAIPMQADRVRGYVLLPGSILPLVRVLLIFGAHYGLQVAAAIHPAERAAYLGWDTVVSGAGAGYFLGWSLRFWQGYSGAPQVELGARSLSR